MIATEARNSKDFDDCAVDFVALIGYRTQALTVKRLAGRCGPIPTSMIWKFQLYLELPLTSAQRRQSEAQHRQGSSTTGGWTRPSHWGRGEHHALLLSGNYVHHSLEWRMMMLSCTQSERYLFSFIWKVESIIPSSMGEEMGAWCPCLKKLWAHGP